MQLGHTIHLERSDNGEVRHSHILGVTLLDDRHALNSASIVGPSLGDLTEEIVVDPIDDLQMTGEQLFEKADFPLFERLGEDSVARRQLSFTRDNDTHLV